MQRKELELADGRLYYEIRRGEAFGEAFIEEFRGQASEVIVPTTIESFPVAGIGKKAFLSKKNIRRIVLPDTVGEVGEWAFAYCSGLEEVVLGSARVRFGRAAFLECTALSKITLETEGFQPELLAAAVTSMNVFYLLELPAVGTKEWLEKWDARLMAILHTPDKSGYSKQVLCGEEDYGSTDLAAYMRRSRLKKARLSFLRLLHPARLSERDRKELENFVLSHTKGCDTDEAWQVILKEHGHEKAYYRFFAELGGVTKENLEAILADIGEEYPEMKAYLLSSAGDESQTEDFFSGLEL